MEPSLKVRNLLKSLAITQAALAGRIGVHPSTIGLYLYGKRRPDALTCLLFAGLAKEPEERHSWIADSGLSAGKIALIARALGAYAERAVAAGASASATAPARTEHEPRYEVKRIIEPGETLISSGRGRESRAPAEPAGGAELPAGIQAALAAMDPETMEALGRMLIELSKQSHPGSSKGA